MEQKKLREILLLLWRQKGIKYYKNIPLSFTLKLGGRIGYKIKMKNVNVYVQI